MPTNDPKERSHSNEELPSPDLDAFLASLSVEPFSPPGSEEDAQITGELTGDRIGEPEPLYSSENAYAAITEPLYATPQMQDVHSKAVGPLSAPISAAVTSQPPTAEVAAPSGAAGSAGSAGSAAPKAPVVEATVQATQAAVSTAKQATQQVTAAVQQQAQKITVAPRKAIYRGKRFLIVYGTMVGAAGVLAVLARRYRYFPADIGITRLLQKPNSKLYDALMQAVSDLGWRWISVGTRASVVTLMWAAGFRMESAFTLSTWSGDVLTGLIKTPVQRPRPTRDLVRVVSDLKEASFPSGHVVHYVTFYGFLFYLGFTQLKQRWFRTALLTFLAGIILLVGPSRIYMGQHWPSDVGGAYLVGMLWLGLTIIAYLETKANYTLHVHPPFFAKRPQQLG
ncbi:MAG: phosphatase PAP2 family protein [Chloroflexi bacterium]|nr:phosphatase PAP2 family protein [Chloroflexota bacterium]